MRRRTLLASAAPALAGCSAFTGENRSQPGSPTRTDSPARTDSPTASAEPTPTVPENTPSYDPTGQRFVPFDGGPFAGVRVDILPDPVPFVGDISLVTQPAGGDPGVLRIALTNGGEHELQLRVNNQKLPFVPTADESGSLAVSHIETWETDGGCPRGPLPVLPATSSWRFDPGATHDGNRDVYALHDRDVCFRAGEYRFTNGYHVERPRGDNELLATFRWGFTLVVEETG